jgi:hypothetical protein
METIYYGILYAIVWVITEIWSIVSNKWVWVAIAIYYLFIQPITRHFSEQDSRLARVENMLRDMMGRHD